jgi:hypothetical protein
MSEGHEYRFKIDAFTPETIPLARLAEYMGDLAVVLGEINNVHFVRIEKGSAVLVQRIDDVALPKVRERVTGVRLGSAPPEAMRAFRQMNKRLKDDNSIGLLSEDSDVEILRFPGKETEEPVTYGPFNQEGTLDGKVIMVGGKTDPVPVHIQQGERIYICTTKRDLASELGHHMFQCEVRVRGTGRWTREADGAWTMHRFTIQSFELLDDQPLSAVVAKLRDVPGSGWKAVSDPWSELIGMREQEDEAH